MIDTPHKLPKHTIATCEMERLIAFISISRLASGQHVLTIDYAGNRKLPDESWREIIHFWN